MRGSLKIVNQSIDSSGITKDYKDAICEYIWNGFEADATFVNIDYKCNVLNGLDSITIQDNGKGINFNQLEDNFGTFLSSQKNLQSLNIKSTKNKGKGRFSFICFSSNVKWKTTFKSDGTYYDFSININENNKTNYDYTNIVASQNTKTGTIVEFYNIKELLPENFYFSALEDKVLQEFSWFLYLNRSKGYKINISGKDVDYKKYINVGLSRNKLEEIGDYNFNIDIIVWQEKINEKFCCYFFDNKEIIKGKETTSFNRNTVEFSHSVFVKSSFFDDKDDVSLNGRETIFASIEERNKIVLKELTRILRDNIAEIMKMYLIEKADKAVAAMEKRKSFPKFSNDVYDQLRKKDLIDVTKEIYCFEPRIFYKLRDIQEKSFLSFLNLLLDSEERENILTIIDEIVMLTPEQRNEFAGILKKTHLKNIIDTIKFIEDRYRVIEILRSLVYDLTNFTNERDHIQEIIEDNYWLFGEQYLLVSADIGMKNALIRYSNILYGETNIDFPLNRDQEGQRRMDIFLCSARKIAEGFNNYKEENIIVELKAPRVTLSKKVYRQVEDYMDYILKQPHLNSQRRIWKFIAICNEVDDDIKHKYITFQDHGKPGLVNKIKNYEIYAYTWDDIFKDFDLRHSFILDKLKYKKELLSKEIEDKITSESRETANLLTEMTIAS